MSEHASSCASWFANPYGNRYSCDCGAAQPAADTIAKPQASLSSNERLKRLPALLREAERRVNAHVFKGPGDSALCSIPANVDRDVDLLLIEAASAIELFCRPAAETSCVGCAQGWHRQSNYPDSSTDVHCPPRFIPCTAVKTSTEPGS